VSNHPITPEPRDVVRDRGVTMIFVAICLVGLMALTGLVIDGGNAFAQRRQMQNAADAAALAGANALQRARQGAPGATPDQVLRDARDAAVDNGADPAAFRCSLVRTSAGGTEVGTAPCPASPSPALPDDAAGVRVQVQSDHVTAFMRVVGHDQFTAAASAAALLRRASVGAAPFMVCANAAGHPVPLLIVDDPLDPESAVVNSAAIGQEYVIYGNDIRDGGRDCGNPANQFRGLVDLSKGPFEIPGWWEADQGNKGGHMLPNIAGGCGMDNADKIKDTPVGCEFALPLCLYGNDRPGNAFQAYCVAAGRFRITKNETPHRLVATVLGGGVVPDGPGSGIAGPGDVAVIKLSE